MRKRKLIPTPLIQDEQRELIEIMPVKKPIFRKWKMWGYIIQWLIKMFWIWIKSPKFKIINSNGAVKKNGRIGRQKGKVTRELFEKLGFLWIKVGQFVSLRSDFLGKEFCEEVSKLQYQARGFPFTAAKKIIEKDLGGPIENYFENFNRTPIAAASIAQVYEARLIREQQDVVLKVMRPEADHVFNEDMKFLSGLLTILNMFPNLKFLNLTEAKWELERIIREEVDYRYEVSNIKRLRKSLRKHKIYIPKSYDKYCTNHVLVMEKVEGVLMSDFIAVAQKDRTRLATWLKENNVKCNLVAKRLLLSFLRQLLEDNLFHGDLHPGNIFLLRNSRIALIDFGSIGSLEKTRHQLYNMYLRALSYGDYHKSGYIFLQMCSPIQPTDLAAIASAISRMSRAWEARSHIKTITSHEKSLASVSEEAFPIMTKYNVPSPWDFLRADRSFTTLDASLSILAPGLDYLKTFQRYYDERAERSRARLTNLKNLKHLLTEIPDALTEFKLFIEPQIRHLGILFKSTKNKIAESVARLLKVVYLAGLAVSIWFAIAFVASHYINTGSPSFFVNIKHSLETIPIFKQLIEFLNDGSVKYFGHFRQEFWHVVFIMNFYLLFNFRKIIKRLWREDHITPSTYQTTR